MSQYNEIAKEYLELRKKPAYKDTIEEAENFTRNQKEYEFTRFIILLPLYYLKEGETLWNGFHKIYQEAYGIEYPCYGFSKDELSIDFYNIFLKDLLLEKDIILNYIRGLVGKKLLKENGDSFEVTELGIKYYLGLFNNSQNSLIIEFRENQHEKDKLECITNLNRASIKIGKRMIYFKSGSIYSNGKQYNLLKDKGGKLAHILLSNIGDKLDVDKIVTELGKLKLKIKGDAYVGVSDLYRNTKRKTVFKETKNIKKIFQNKEGMYWIDLSEI